MASYRIVQWERTQTQYVAVLQVASVFEPDSIRVAKQEGTETILVGRVALTGREEPYALAYSRHDLTFEEARAMAARWLETYRPDRPL